MGEFRKATDDLKNTIEREVRLEELKTDSRLDDDRARAGIDIKVRASSSPSRRPR